MKRLIPFIALSFFMMFSCNSSQNEGSENANNETSSTNVSEYYLPSITLEELEGLHKACNQIDYLFYELPFSSSINEQKSARIHLRHISEDPVPMTAKNNCGKALGRIFYKADGEDLIESEIYFGSGCTFFVFFKNGQPTYSNFMTSDGVTHFNQIFETILNATKAQQK